MNVLVVKIIKIIFFISDFNTFIHVYIRYIKNASHKMKCFTNDDLDNPPMIFLLALVSLVLAC